MRDLGRENPEMKSNAPTNADLCARKRRARIVVVENDDNDAFFLERALARAEARAYASTRESASNDGQRETVFAQAS